MDKKLMYFIGDLLDFVSSGQWNDFENFCREKGYSDREIDSLTEELDGMITEQ